MSENLTTGKRYVREGASSKLSATLRDLDNSTLNKAAITALTIRIQDEDGNVINDRDGSNAGSNVLDTNGGTVDADGSVTVILSPDDNPMITTKEEEIHFVQFKYQWTASGGTQTGRENGHFRVAKLGFRET